MSKVFFYDQNLSSSDRFVGLNLDDDGVHITFPLGYSTEGKDKNQLKKDAGSLIKLLARKDIAEGSCFSGSDSIGENISALGSALFILQDYIRTRRLLSEKISLEIRSSDGAIDWGKTVSKINPIVSGSNIIYSNLISRKTGNNFNSLITAAHEIAVNKSIDLLGWMYNEYYTAIPRAEKVTADIIFSIRQRIANTFNTYELKLLVSILEFLTDLSSSSIDIQEGVGTRKFEYYWEFMVDVAFGVSPAEKRRFFPRAVWSLEGGNSYNSPLQPDTIMKNGSDIFILDSKYYKFGVSGIPHNLPGSSDIFKQILYGEYAYSINSNFLNSIYNAFIIPGDLSQEGGGWFKISGHAEAEWVETPEKYQIVVAVLVDTSFLIDNYSFIGVEEKNEFVNAIEFYVNSVVGS